MGQKATGPKKVKLHKPFKFGRYIIGKTIGQSVRSECLHLIDSNADDEKHDPKNLEYGRFGLYVTDVRTNITESLPDGRENYAFPDGTTSKSTIFETKVSKGRNCARFITTYLGAGVNYHGFHEDYGEYVDMFEDN